MATLEKDRCTGSVECQYIRGHIDFNSYVELVEAHSKEAEKLVFSNRISRDLIAHCGRGFKSSVTDSKESVKEAASIKVIKEILLDEYAGYGYDIVEVESNSMLDTMWKADLILFPSDCIGIPIQVKSSKSQLHRFRCEMRDRAGKLPVTLLHTGEPKCIYVKPPISTRPPNLGDISRLVRTRQLKDEIDKALTEC